MAEQETRLQARPEGLNWREIDGQVVILDLEHSHYLNLNVTGSVLWPLLVEGTTHAALVERLVEEFDIDHATAERDVSSFVTSCTANGLLSVADAT